jgi:hypothetical protein
MANRNRVIRAISQAEALIERAKLADWAGQAIAWVDEHGAAGDRDALARWLTLRLRDQANSVWLDDIVDEASLALAEREQRLAFALTELDLGDFTDDDQGRLLALLPKLPAEFAPLAAMLAPPAPLDSADP